MKAFRNLKLKKAAVLVLTVGMAFTQLGNSSVKALETAKTENAAVTQQTADTSANASVGTNALEQAIIKNPNGVIKEHKLIAENDKYELYFKEDALSIIMRDKETGSIMESVVDSDNEKVNETWKTFLKSGIVLQVLKGINVAPTTADVRKAEKKVTISDTGFSAEVYYKDYKIGYTLNVSLTDDGFTAEIPNSSIKEDSDEYKIGEVYVYPFLGNTRLGDRDGYMFIPDGNGALINLENNEGRFTGTSFSEYVYGSNVGMDESSILSLFWDEFQTVNDSEKILCPVYGMVHTDSQMAFLGIIESGQYSAKIEAYPNGAYTDYNWITSKFIVRQIYNQPTSNTDGSIVVRQKNRNEFDIKIKYCFTNKENADYTGLALKYRDYLLANDLIKKQDDDFNVRLDFLGTEKENWLLFKKTVTMTTADNIREILDELGQEGVTDILAVYKGWQKGGINSLPITSYSADRAIGGTSDLTALIKDTKEKGIDFYLAQDALRINPGTNNTTFNAVKKINKRVYEEETYKDVFEKFNYLIPGVSKSTLKVVGKSYLKKDVNNIMLSGITNNLYSYTYKGDTFSRVNTAQNYEDAVSNMSGDFNLMLEQPFSYMWKYSKAIADMPVGSSDYTYIDEEIPFLSIVLSGIMPMYSDYINFEANKNEFFLNLVEMGINPSFYITYEDPAELQNTNSSDIYSSKYSVYKDNIIKYYDELKAVHEKVIGANITDHEKLSNGITKVTYSNGVIIYVNYSDSAQKADGYSIEPMSYKVGEAK